MDALATLNVGEIYACLYGTKSCIVDIAQAVQNVRWTYGSLNLDVGLDVWTVYLFYYHAYSVSTHYINPDRTAARTFRRTYLSYAFVVIASSLVIHL